MYNHIQAYLAGKVLILLLPSFLPPSSQFVHPLARHRSSTGDLRRPHDITSQEHRLLVAEIRDVAHDLLSASAARCSLESVERLELEHGLDLVRLVVRELDYLPGFETLWLPGLVDEGHLGIVSDN